MCMLHPTATESGGEIFHCETVVHTGGVWLKLLLLVCLQILQTFHQISLLVALPIFYF